jgi:hypothetical protein
MELYADDVHQTVLNEETLRDSTARTTTTLQHDAYTTQLKDGSYPLRYTVWKGMVPLVYSFIDVHVRDGVYDVYSVLNSVDALVDVLYKNADVVVLAEIVEVDGRYVEVYLAVDM